MPQTESPLEQAIDVATAEEEEEAWRTLRADAPVRARDKVMKNFMAAIFENVVD